MMEQLWRTPQYWAIVLLAGLLMSIGHMAEGWAYLPFSFVMVCILLAAGTVRVH